MTQCIHYEDNIFFILDSLTFLERGLKLDIDETYFGEKIFNDILFFDSAIHNIFVSLEESTLQKDKNQYFRLLSKTLKLYIGICEDIIEENTGKTIDFSGFKPKLNEIIINQKESMKTIEGILNSDKNDEEDGGEQISQKEMLFLMSREEESGA